MLGSEGEANKYSYQVYIKGFAFKSGSRFPVCVLNNLRVGQEQYLDAFPLRHFLALLGMEVLRNGLLSAASFLTPPYT